MIPKVIHYCWFGGKTKPKDVLDCIATWHQLLPDYDIREWNESNFDYKKIAYTYEAYKLNKFAFVSDVARLYALLTEGGVYLDTDVKVLQSFDPYLKNHSFIGMESPYRVSTAVIGAEPNIDWMQDFYKLYTNKHFIGITGKLKYEPNTQFLTYFFSTRYPYDEKMLMRYDIEYFCGKIFLTNEYKVTTNTVAIHEFQRSWGQVKCSLLQRVKNIVLRYFVMFRIIICKMNFGK